MGSKYNSISLGDRIFVKIMSNNAVVSELTVVNINSMSELITHLHTVYQNLKGLSTLFIRNMTKGWTMRRPIMFYGSSYARVSDKILPSMKSYGSKMAFNSQF